MNQANCLLQSANGLAKWINCLAVCSMSCNIRVVWPRFLLSFLIDPAHNGAFFLFPWWKKCGWWWYTWVEFDVTEYAIGFLTDMREKLYLVAYIDFGHSFGFLIIEFYTLYVSNHDDDLKNDTTTAPNLSTLENDTDTIKHSIIHLSCSNILD